MKTARHPYARSQQGAEKQENLSWWSPLKAWLELHILRRKPPLRIVLDTNVLIDSMQPDSSPAGKILELVWQDKFRLLMSPATLHEARLVLAKPNLRGKNAIRSEDKALLLKHLEEKAVLTHNRPLKYPVAEHEADDKFLAAAVAGQADYLLTEDRHLLHVKSYRGIKVTTPERFLKKI